MFIRPRLCALGTLGNKVGGSALRSPKGERCYSTVVTANCYRCADRSLLRGNAEERREWSLLPGEIRRDLPEEKVPEPRPKT